MVGDFRMSAGRSIFREGHDTECNRNCALNKSGKLLDDDVDILGTRKVDRHNQSVDILADLRQLSRICPLEELVRASAWLDGLMQRVWDGREGDPPW